MPDSLAPESLMLAAAQSRSATPTQVDSIEDVTRTRLLKVDLHTPLARVASMLSEAQVSLVVVCNTSGSVAGVITETVLIRQLGFGQADIFGTRADQVMVRDFTVCEATDSLPGVLAMMHLRGVTHVLVLNADSKPVGVLVARDGLRALLAAGNYEEALLRSYVNGVGYQ